MLSCLKKGDGERQQHMSAVVIAALTGLAYHLRSPSLWVWLPLMASTAEKSTNIKENRRAAELRHQYFFSSSSPPPATTVSPFQTTAPSVASLSFPYTTVSKLSEGGCDITRISQKSRGSSRQWQPVLCLPPRQGPCLAHQDCLSRKRREKTI